jgi:hypothetical protein
MNSLSKLCFFVGDFFSEEFDLCDLLRNELDFFFTESVSYYYVSSDYFDYFLISLLLSFKLN